MLNEILNPMSHILLSAHAMEPIVASDLRASRWAERASASELRLTLPDAQPGDGASLESSRSATLRRLTALLSGNIGETAIQRAAQHIHTLLNTASWSDVSTGDPYRCDPCGMDAAFAETACTLATCLNLLRQPLSQISPTLPARIEQALNRRALIPLSGGEPPSHLSLRSCCLLLIAAILGGPVESIRWQAISNLCYAMEQRLNRLPADGSMPGGIECAVDTAILLMDAAEIISLATRGRIDLTRHERIICMADYPLFAHLQQGCFVNPGDHPMQPALDAESLFRFGHRASDNALCDLSAWLLRTDRACASPHLITRLLNRRTTRLLDETPGRIRLFRDGFLPDAGLMFMRGFHLHIAMTGATGTPHADAGNICLFYREQPILIDIGAAARDTNLHSLPTINGIGQLAPIAPNRTECGSGAETTTCYTVNLTAAYPAQCHISDYQRTLLMGSASTPGIRLIDVIELTEPLPVDFHFICACEPHPSSDGITIGPVLLQYIGELSPAVEALPEQRLFRLTLHADPALCQRYIFEFIPG